MPTALALDAGRAIVAVVLALSVAWTGHLLALRVLRDARTSIRWCGGAIASLWLLVASFWLLGAARAFVLPVVAIGWVAVAAGLHVAVRRTVDPIRQLRLDLGRVRAHFVGLGRWERVLAGAVAFVGAVRFFRFLAGPPLGWDDLTYHLVKAARWVQAGGFVEIAAPDAWGAYGYFPVAGEILWAWAMLPSRGGALLAPAALLVWALAMLGVYAAARELGAGCRPATLASLAVAAMPATLSYVSTAYVDNMVLASFALGSVFVIRVARGGSNREAPLAIAGLALAAGAKLTAVPLLALGGVVVLFSAVRHGPDRKRTGIVIGLCCLVCLPAAPSYARAWVERGSPLYPYALQVAGVELLEGNREVSEVSRLLLEDADSRYTAWDSLHFLVARASPSGTFVNPGIGALVTLLLALPATLRLSAAERSSALFLWGVTISLVATFFSGQMEVVRTTSMVTTAGRYLMPGIAAAAMIAARLDGHLPRVLWTMAILCGVVFAWPRGWCEPCVAGTALGALLGGVGVVCILFALRPSRHAPALARVCLAVMIAAGMLVGVQKIRARFRSPIYERAADWVDPAYSLHPLHPSYASAWPIWRRLDGDEPRTVAATAGFEDKGHNWYLYPEGFYLKSS